MQSTRRTLTSTFRRSAFYSETITRRQRSRLDSENREPPESARSSRDLQQSQSFNPFSQESKEMIHEVANVELCELLDMEPKAQCKSMSVILGRGHRPLHVRTLLAQRNGGELKISPVHPWISSRFRITISRKGDPTGTVMGRNQGITSTSSRTRFKKKCKKKNFLGIHDRFHPRREIPQEYV